MIDVIIPVYNGEKFIAEAIDSVLAQTHKPEKIIVVNDGSTDDTGAIIDRYTNTTIPVVHIKKTNGGLSNARNTGINASTAPLLAFLDADDVWSPEKLGQQLAVLAQSNAGLVYCDYQTIDERGVVTDDTGSHVTPEDQGNVFEKILEKNSISSSGSGVLIRRECFNTCGLFNESLNSYEDWDMWIRIAKVYQIDFADEVLVSIRKHGSNMQQNTSRMLTNEIILYRNTIDSLELKHAPKRWADNLCLAAVLTFPRSINSLNKIHRGFPAYMHPILFKPYKSIFSYFLYYLSVKITTKVRKIFS